MIAVVAIKVLTSLGFELFGTDSVNWTIAYIASENLFYAASCMFFAMLLENYVKDAHLIANYYLPKWSIKHHKFLIWCLNGSGIYFLAHTLIELTYLNTAMATYKASISNGYWQFTHASSMLFAIVVYFGFYYVKRTYKYLQWI